VAPINKLKYKISSISQTFKVKSTAKKEEVAIISVQAKSLNTSKITKVILFNQFILVRKGCKKLRNGIFNWLEIYIILILRYTI